MNTKDIAQWETINLADRYASIVDAYDSLLTITQHITQSADGNDINVHELQERITMPLFAYKVLLSELVESIRGDA